MCAILTMVLIVWFCPIFPKVFSHNDMTSARFTPTIDKTLINISDILQACVTVLIGILIFLTLERKFEKTYQPLMSIAMRQTISDLDSDITTDNNRLKRIEEKIRMGVSDQNDLDDKSELEQRIKQKKHERTTFNDYLTILGVDKEIEDQTEIRLKRLKDKEDAVTLSTVSIFSLCVVLTIFVIPEWIYYDVLTRAIFTIGMAFLIFRVYLSTKDPQDQYKRIKENLISQKSHVANDPSDRP